MKKTFLFSALAAAAMLMSSCSSDEPVNVEQNKLVKGDPTYTAFSISMATPSANRAPAMTDEYGVTEEQAISTISIYIFSGGVLEVAATPEMSDANNNVTVPVAVSTGEKVVYAIAGKCELAVTQESTLLKDFEKMLFSALSSDIAGEKNFTMIGRANNVTVTKCSEQEALNNPVKITVDRAAAKVQVAYNNPNIRPTLNAEFPSATFTLAQQARQMYVELGNRFTPLGIEEGKTTADYTSTFPGLVPVTSIVEDDYITAPDVFDNSFTANKYTGECVAEAPTTGNVTFAAVRVQCKPKAYYNDASANTDGTFWTVGRNIPETATWIYTSDEDYNILYFASEGDATAYLNAHQALKDGGYQFCKFDKGLCYYRVNIMNAPEEKTDLSKKYRVVRNSYYRINVTDIKGLGAPSADGVVPTDPDTPIEQDSHMAAEITVAPWLPVNQGAVLQ